MSDWKECLSSIYYNVGYLRSYAGPEALYKVVAVTERSKLADTKFEHSYKIKRLSSLTRTCGWVGVGMEQDEPGLV